MSFADNLKRLLAEKGVSQSELSRRTGINRPMISEYTHGRYEPKTDNLFKIAKALGVGITDLSEDCDLQMNNISIGTNNGAISGSGNATVVNNTSAEQCELLSFLAKKFDIPELKRIKIDFATGSILAGGRKISDLTNPTIALCLQALSQELSRAAKEHNNKIDFVIE